MRDPKRIKRKCLMLDNAWNRYIELRLDQFLINFIFGSWGRDSHIYFKEDDDIEVTLEIFIQNFNKNEKDDRKK